MRQDIVLPIDKHNSYLNFNVTLSKLPITQGFPYDTEHLIDHELFATLELILFYPNLFVTRKHCVIN